MTYITSNQPSDFLKSHKVSLAWWAAALLTIVLALFTPNILLMTPVGFIPIIAGIYRATAYKWFPKNPLAIISYGCLPVVAVLVVMVIAWPVIELARQSVYLFREYRASSTLPSDLKPVEGTSGVE